MSRLNAVGRFWVGYALVLALALGWASSAHAGYYATVGSQASGTYCTVGYTSSCRLTLGMAINAACYTVGEITAVDLQAKTFTGRNTGNGHTVTGTFGECQTTPAGGTQPSFIGGLSDPGIVGGGVSGGSGGSGGSGYVEEPFDYAKASALFSFFFAFVVGVYIVSKNIGMILEAIRRW